MGKRIALLFLAAWFTAAAAGCGHTRSGDSPSGPVIFCLNETEDGLTWRAYEGELTGDRLLEEISRKEPAAGGGTDLKPLLPEEVEIKGHSVGGTGLVTVDFSGSYRNMSSTREVLVRAGIVRTLVQADDVERVCFTIEGDDAVSPDGVALGIMNANSFVEDAGKQINTIQNTTINLYYANEAGTALRAEGRSIYYSASKPLEWAIVERVIAGPKDSGNYPTVPSTTQIINVSSSNGVCYVNLNQAFETNALTNLDKRLPVYSIVNSLLAKCEGIEEVQISIEGESNRTFLDSIDLSTPFREDFSLVENVNS
ncbi:MAG: GerMN domain-containing protein [Lachnospiraceae bacterium]|nr:GerMN domain-containing protein [Lachnospiraceae bacterium]